MARKKKIKKRRSQEKKEIVSLLPADKGGQKNRLPVIFLAFFLILAAAFLVWHFFSPREGVMRRSDLNVLLITLDTTREDRLGCYGYEKGRTPNLDSLAARGVRFENAYAQVPLTTPSHCSILTGTLPLYHQVRNNGAYSLPDQLTTLAEIFGDKGFDTAAFVGSFTVDSRFGLDQGFAVYDDTFAEGQAFKALNSERKAEKVYESFARWLEKRNNQPFFCWVHFFDPHLPYDPPPPYDTDFADNPYDGEIAYMDRYVGKTIEALRSRNVLGQTLLVLAGDHGEAFGEKTETGHGVFLYDGTMRVPLIFYREGHLPSGLVVSPRVRLIDIAPTILDMLAIPAPKEMQGTSLVPYIEGKKKKDLTNYIETYFPLENYGWSPLVGVVDGDWKYIRAPREELYHLKADPGETKNRIDSDIQTAAEKRRRLDEIIAHSTSEISSTRRTLTAEEQERLRSLGYVAPTGETPKGPLPDPKDMLPELELSQQAEAYEMEGKYAEAARIYEEMLARRPENQTAYVNLALMKARLNQFGEAVSVLERGIALFPESVMLLSRLAHTHMVMGRLKKALDTWQAVLTLEPYYFDGLLGSGWILDLMGNKKEARSFYEKALRVEPENKFLRKNYAMNLATSGKIREATEVYERLKSDYPEDYEVWQDLGIAYGYAGDLSRSIENLERAIELHPTPVGYLNLAVAFRKVGHIEKAVECLGLYLANPEGETAEKIARAQQELAYLKKVLEK
ncbi:MAG: sulfatase-like hydrolase/transferase [Clostridiales bacterium]|nr:sulfatase-like hydrolase/transferase [Clostridiales bacterium]